MKKIWIFDLDGTLVDSSESMTEAIYSLLVREYKGMLQPNINKGELIEKAAKTMKLEDAIKSVIPDVSEPSLKLFWAELVYYDKLTTLREGTRAVLNHLDDHDCFVFFATNRLQEHAESVCYRLYLAFDEIIGIKKPDFSDAKPNYLNIIEAFQLFQEESLLLGLPKYSKFMSLTEMLESACFVGDSDTDKETARRLGIEYHDVSEPGGLVKLLESIK